MVKLFFYEVVYIITGFLLFLIGVFLAAPRAHGGTSEGVVLIFAILTFVILYLFNNKFAKAHRLIYWINLIFATLLTLPGIFAMVSQF